MNNVVILNTEMNATCIVSKRSLCNKISVIAFHHDTLMKTYCKLQLTTKSAFCESKSTYLS